MKIRILVVDDDEDLLFLANKFLGREDERFELVGAKTDQEALQKLEEEDFDAIVCDHYLGPHCMTGLDLLEWVREARPNIPFIILTGRSQEAVAIRALNLGADFYLKKGTDEVSELFSQIAHKIIREVEQQRSKEALEMAYEDLEKRVRKRTSELEELNERLSSEIEKRKRAEQSLVLQQQLGNALCRSNSITDALDVILKTAVQLDGVDSGGIYLIDNKTGNIDLSTSQGFSAHFLQNFLRDNKGNPLTHPLYLSKSEVQSSPDIHEQYADLTAAAFIPILLEENPVAFLSVASHDTNEIAKKDKNTLEAIAVQISAYMARIRFEKQIEESKSEILSISETLNECFLIINEDFRVLYANKNALNLFGETMGQQLQRAFQDYFAGRSKNKVIGILKKTLSGKDTCQRVIFDSKGNATELEIKAVKGKHDGQDVLFIIADRTSSQ
jgi:DNA-binding response OmpR family regulator